MPRSVIKPNNTGGIERYVAIYYPNFNQPGSWNDWSDRTADPIGLPFNGVVEIIPQLAVSRQNGAGLQFSWPIAMPNAVLEGTTNLSVPFSPVSYTLLTNAAAGIFSVATPASVPQMFFRLRP